MVALIPLILQGLTVLPGILGAFKALLCKGSTATAQQKVDIVASTAGSVVSIAAGVTSGATQKDLLMAQAALPHVQQLTDTLMNMAEVSGQSGDQKLAFVNTAFTQAMQGFEALTTGKIATEAAAIQAQATPIINALVPVLFPKDDAVVQPAVSGT